MFVARGAARFATITFKVLRSNGGVPIVDPLVGTIILVGAGAIFGLWRARRGPTWIKSFFAQAVAASVAAALMMLTFGVIIYLGGAPI